MGNGKDTDAGTAGAKATNGMWSVPQGSLWLLATLHGVCNENKGQRPEQQVGMSECHQGWDMVMLGVGTGLWCLDEKLWRCKMQMAEEGPA